MPTCYDWNHGTQRDSDDYPLPLCRDGRSCFGDCDRCDNPHDAYIDCDDACQKCPEFGPPPACLERG